MSHVYDHAIGELNLARNTLTGFMDVCLPGITYPI